MFLLIVPLAGCTLWARKQAAAPPPPNPAAVQPAAPAPPLSIPQTAVTLPSRQEFNPDAIPKVPAAQEAPAPAKTETPPAPRASHRTAKDPPKSGATDTEAEAPPPPAVPEQTPLVQPILGVEQQTRIQRLILARKREITEKLDRLRGHLSSHDKTLMERIDSFLTQCDQAAQRGDYSQADALSDRAVILVREIQE